MTLAELRAEGSGTIAPVLKYPGSKWRLAPWIITHMPPHTHYIEPFFGSGAVFFQKVPVKHVVLNDRDDQVVNLFQVIREQPDALVAAVTATPWSRTEYERCCVDARRGSDGVEQARRFLVRCWQMHGSRTSRSHGGWRNQGVSIASTTTLWNRLPVVIAAVAQRLKGAEIECRPALDVIRRYNHRDCLIYADPPYLLDTRTGGVAYRYEMTEPDHCALLDALDQHRGPVLLSGYDSDLYQERLAHWTCVRTMAQAEKGQAREECLWLSPQATAPGRLPLFAAEGW